MVKYIECMIESQDIIFGYQVSACLSISFVITKAAKIFYCLCQVKNDFYRIFLFMQFPNRTQLTFSSIKINTIYENSFDSIRVISLEELRPDWSKERYESVVLSILNNAQWNCY